MTTSQSFEATVAAARTIVGDESGGLEASIDYMRRSGFSPIDCIRAVMVLCGMPLAEAKEIVHNSDCWADMRPAHEQLQRNLADELEREL
jgi:hypothetical protein